MSFSTPPRLTVGIALSLLGCSTPIEPAAQGEPCSVTIPCATGTSCFNTNVGQSICMETCAETDRLCEGGEVCLANEERDDFVCYTGGTLMLGADCTSSAQCELSVCVDVENEGQQCYAACVIGDDTPCGTNETCLPIASSNTNGYCE